MKHYATAIIHLFSLAALSLTLAYVGVGTGNEALGNIAAISALTFFLAASFLLYRSDVRTHREFVREYEERRYARMLALSTMESDPHDPKR